MEEVYKEYSKIIYKYLYSLTHDSDVAEDLMQDTFLSAIMAVNKMPRSTKILPWLYTIAKNKFIDYYRKKLKYKHISIEQIEEIAYFESYDNVENDSLYKAINELDENSKNLILLKIKADLTLKQIGELLGYDENWAKVTYHRAKQKLKGVLEDEE